MGTPPIRKLEPLTREKLIKLLDPGRVFYRVAAPRARSPRAIRRSSTALAASLKEIQAEYRRLRRADQSRRAAARKAGG